MMISISTIFLPENSYTVVRILSAGLQLVQLFVSDITGKQMLAMTIKLGVTHNEIKTSFANWGAGMYNLNFKNAAGINPCSIKIIKE